MNASPAADSSTYLERFLALHPKSIDLSLARLERLLAALGHPERKLPPVIHVAGTNGKGSTIAFCRAMLEADGRSCHVFTSPHLVRFHERIRLGAPGGGRLVEEEALAEAFERCEQANGGEPITFFEITTAAAFLLFAEHPADVLLLEVGLGGRLDATNVIYAPLVSVITPVSIDHTGFLGDTLEKIAAEKAGIIKPGCPVVLSPQRAAAEAVILARAAACGAPVSVAGQDWQAYEENGRLVYQDGQRLLDLPLPNLLGRHQITNAGTAIATLGAAQLLPGADAIAKGVTGAYWPARLQRLEASAFTPLKGKRVDVYLDGAHNEGAAKVLSAALAEMNEKNSAPLTLILGMLTTKDAAAFLAEFRGLAARVLAVPVPGEHAGEDPGSLAAVARDLGFVADHYPSLEAALQEAARSGEAQRILITGSLYLAGSVLEKIKAL